MASDIVEQARQHVASFEAIGGTVAYPWSVTLAKCVASQDEEITRLRAALREREAAAVPAGWSFDMAKAPRNGTLLQLLISHDDEEDCSGGGFDDAERTRTMGFNNFDHDEIDRWIFPGWSWSHDCINEQGCGRPVAWALMLALPDDPGAPEPQAGTRSPS